MCLLICSRGLTKGGPARLASAQVVGCREQAGNTIYTHYFGLREEPFADSADPRFFYANPRCQKAYSTLLSGIRDYTLRGR
jgi:hypothetical protein